MTLVNAIVAGAKKGAEAVNDAVAQQKQSTEAGKHLPNTIFNVAKKAGNDVARAQNELVEANQPKKAGLGAQIGGKIGAVVMAGPTFGASLIYMAGKSIEGLFTSKSFDQAMDEALKTVDQGRQMLEDMWNGIFF